MSKSSTENLITTKEAAGLLREGIRKTIRRVESGQLKPAKKLPGLRGAYLFDRSAVEALTETSEALAEAGDRA